MSEVQLGSGATRLISLKKRKPGRGASACRQERRVTEDEAAALREQQFEMRLYALEHGCANNKIHLWRR